MASHRREDTECQAGATGSITGWRRSPGGGNDNPLQYSCLGNPMDRGAWQATVHRVTESDMTEQLDSGSSSPCPQAVARQELQADT